ncbi:hypothetical protein HX866_31450 [Pseudomonas gingeri]|uniref:hypothetical protein n=1 Tax=Pseudomonas gingeri TaxID=117681 RepID=UPI0015A07201|nr:hypothetical protein [Pseudomonas gingeri]NWA29411.1 hypothetical protein [Pseudomonas gingeri]
MHAVETSLIKRRQEIFMGQAVLNNKLDPRPPGGMDESAGTGTPAEPRYSGEMEPLAKHLETLASNNHQKMLALGRSVLSDKSVETYEAFEVRALELHQASLQLIQDALHPTSTISTQAQLIFRQFDAGALDQLADEQLGRFSDSIDHLLGLVTGSASLNSRELGLRLVREGMTDFEGFLQKADEEIVQSLVSSRGESGRLAEVLERIYARDIDLGSDLDLDTGVALDIDTWALRGPEFKELADSARNTSEPGDAFLHGREIEMLEDWQVDPQLEAEVFAWTHDQPDGYSDGQITVPLLNDIATSLSAVIYPEYA